MSRTIRWFVLVLLGCLARSAYAGSWSLGAHVSASVVRGDANEGSTGIWGAPSNVLGYQPALRVAWGDAVHKNDVLLDVGGLAIDQPGSNLSLAIATLGYQHAFGTAHSFSPIVDAETGAVREDDAQVSWAPLFGLGAGVRHLIRDDHGAVRIEARWDLVETDHTTGRPRLDSFGIRAGFDLWL